MNASWEWKCTQPTGSEALEGALNRLDQGGWDIYRVFANGPHNFTVVARREPHPAKAPA